MSIPDKIAAATSIIFSPFLVPIATILLIVQRYAVTGLQAFLWATIVILFASLIPVIFIFILFCLGRVDDLHLAVKEQRISPLLFSMVSALIGAGILYLSNAPQEIIWAVMAYVVNGVVFTGITPVWKISFHTGVSAGCVTVLMFLMHAKFGWLFLLIPLIAWARIHRKRHTPLQTTIGALVAVVSTSVVLQLLLTKSYWL